MVSQESTYENGNGREPSKSKSSSTSQSRSTKVSPAASEDNRRGRQMTRETASNPLSAENLRNRGYHTLRPSYGKPFHVENRWRMVRELGQGAYGMVISAEDKISGETIAIKMVTRIFDKVQLAKRALREITLLRHFSTRGHENITGLIDLDAIHPDFNEIYLFMEPMEADLHQIIRSGQQLTNEHVQYFVYQILRGMKYIHSASVIHRDLKPGNLLVNSDCELKICDFGLANTFEGVHQLTEYVATRWYRAPEIMLTFKRYGTPIDVWSIGCILAELLLGKPLFRGKDYVDQLNRILDFLGTPGEDIFDRIASDKAKAYMRSLPIRKPQSFQKVFSMADPLVIDLLQKMIVWDPDKRISVIEALEHPWLANYHDPTDEPACPKKFDRYNDYEHLTTIEEFRAAIWKEIQDFREEVRSLHPPVDETPPLETVSEAEPAAEGLTPPEEPPAMLPPSDEAGEVPTSATILTEEPAAIKEELEPLKEPKPLHDEPEPLEEPKLFHEEPEPMKEEAEKIDDLPPPRPRDPSTLTSSNDPIISYRRRSSIFQTSTSPNLARASGHFGHQSFPTSGGYESAGEGYVVPARSRAASIMSGQSQLLRTLSTFSIHENLEPELIKKLVAPTAAEAPPSSMPTEFANTDTDQGKEDMDSQ